MVRVKVAALQEYTKMSFVLKMVTIFVCPLSNALYNSLTFAKHAPPFLKTHSGTASFCIFNDYRGHHRKGVAIYGAI